MRGPSFKGDERSVSSDLFYSRSGLLTSGKLFYRLRLARTPELDSQNQPRKSYSFRVSFLWSLLYCANSTLVTSPLFFHKSYLFSSLWTWISASRSSWSLAQVTLLFANPGCLLGSRLMLMPFTAHSEFQNISAQQTEKARVRPHSLLLCHISTWSFHSLCQIQMSLRYSCVWRGF